MKQNIWSWRILGGNPFSCTTALWTSRATSTFMTVTAINFRILEDAELVFGYTAGGRRGSWPCPIWLVSTLLMPQTTRRHLSRSSHGPPALGTTCTAPLARAWLETVCLEPRQGRPDSTCFQKVTKHVQTAEEEAKRFAGARSPDWFMMSRHAGTHCMKWWRDL